MFMANVAFEVLTCLAAVGIIVYEVCLLSSSRAIPFWQGAMVPVTFTLWAAACGLTLVLAFDPAATNLESAALAVIIALALAIAFSLWAATKSSEASAASAKEVLSGSLARLFWIAGVVIGIVGTAAIVGTSMLGFVSGSVNALAWICAVIGTLGFTLCIFKAAKYRSLI